MTINPGSKNNLSGVTVTASNVYNVENFSAVTVHHFVSGGSTGGALTTLGSNDGVNFYQIAYIDMASTTTTTAITTHTTNNTTFMAALQGSLLGFKYLKVTVTITDGTHTVNVAGTLNR